MQKILSIRLGWSECRLTEDYRKYKSPDVDDAVLNTNSQEKSIPPLSIDFRFLEDIIVSDNEETEVTGAAHEPVIEQKEEKTRTPSPSRFNPYDLLQTPRDWEKN